jgi:hypothetical protein
MGKEMYVHYTRAKQPLTADLAAQIVREYAASLAASKASLDGVADENKLPHPKRYIKEALIIALRATTDEDRKKQLRAAYVLLAEWQPGVGAEPVSSDFGAMQPGASVEDLARQIVARGDRMAKWAPLVSAESQALADELQKLGLW